MKIKIYSSIGIFHKDLTVDGGVIFNHLTLHEHPKNEPQAATKGYVDNFTHPYDASLILGAALDKQRLFTGVSGDVVYTSAPDISLKPSGVTPGTYTHVTVNHKGQVIRGVNNKAQSPLRLVFGDMTQVPTSVTSYTNNPLEYVLTQKTKDEEVVLLGELRSAVVPTHQHQPTPNKYLREQAASLKSTFKIGHLRLSMPDRLDGLWLKANGSVVNRSDYPDLFDMIGHKYSGILYNMYQVQGQPWSQQHTFNASEQTASQLWRISDKPLPTALAYSQPIVTKNKVYLIGGESAGAATNKVWVSNLSVGGELQGWSEAENFPVTIVGHQVLMTSTRVYVLGGVVNGYYSSAVYTAPLMDDGSIGTWVQTEPLADIFTYGQLAVIGSTVYLIGGYDGQSGMSSVLKAQIDTAGYVSGWQKTESMERSVYKAKTIVTKSWLFLIGGYVNEKTSNAVYRCYINEDGSLESWQFSGYIPIAAAFSQVVVLQNKVYLISGKNSALSTKYPVFVADILPDGQFSTWRELSALTEAVDSPAVFVTSSKLYLAGGYTRDNQTTPRVQWTVFYGGYNDYPNLHGQFSFEFKQVVGAMGQPWRQQHLFNNHSWTITPEWRRERDFPARLYLSQCVVTNNRVFMLGGLLDGVGTKNIYGADILPDGNVGSWSVCGTLPKEVYGSQAVVTKNKVYLISGTNSNHIYRADILNGSSIGPWTIHSSFAQPIAQSQVIITTNRLYILGGKNTNIVHTCVIDDEGVLQSFERASSLPIGVSSSHAAVTNSHVYLIGGYGQSDLVSVYSAAINKDGTLEEWTVQQPLPVPVRDAQIYVTQTHVYIVSGFVQATRSTLVHTAVIYNDGSLGAWSSEPGAPLALSDFQLFNTSSRIYIVGGRSNTGTSAQVYSTPMIGGSNTYVSQINNQVISTRLQFRLPDLTGKTKPPMEYFIRALA